MNLTTLLPILLIVASIIRPETCTASLSSESNVSNEIIQDDDGEADDVNVNVNVNVNDDDDDDDDSYYNLEDMTNEELEEICNSRGFELVREADNDDGDYTHQDYVDAAAECLQIEADLEEILETHPEILEDVKRESERMMKQRDSLLLQLNQQQQQQQQGMEANDDDDVIVEDIIEDGIDEDDKVTGITEDHVEDNNKVLSNNTTTPIDPNLTQHQSNNNKNELNYDIKEITIEVLQQMKSDVTKVFNFILPPKLREKIVKLQIIQRIQPTLQTFVSIAKDMESTVYDMARRYLKMVIVYGKGRGEDRGDDAFTTSSDVDTVSSGEMSTTTSSTGEEERR